jgi:hypothetical protein
VAGLIAIVVDRLFAQNDEARLLGADDALQQFGDRQRLDRPSVLIRMPRSAPMARPVRKVSAACAGPIEITITSLALPASSGEALLRRRFRRMGSSTF